MSATTREADTHSTLRNDPTLSRRDPVRTIIALFDDTIDAEHALTALRRSNQPPAEISVVLRERIARSDPRTGRETLLSRVVASSALEAVGGWLQGLASLILPEDRASYLVAGPIGVMLASIRDVRPERGAAGEEGSLSDDREEFKSTNRQLTRALALFGFDQDEATYVELRVVVGSPLIAVTSEHAPVLRAAHEIFFQHTAVHIGLTHTDSSIQATAARLLMTGPLGGGPVVITDAVAPLRSLDEPDYFARLDRSIRNRPVVSKSGQAIGKVSDVLYETQMWESDANHADTHHTVSRYVIIESRGGLLLSPKRVAIPAELVEMEQNPVLLRISQAEVRGAPRYDSSRPLSRQDEVALRRYFHVRNYWMTAGYRANPDDEDESEQT
jgi:hypothetical protein